ncbi:flagellar basal-body MS-ring/collar protein FliF [uncultured Erythrobacter sp.]|uniref:flagellar basal-body MS-ring/collar protein FliF n=1 Tax=uncultured Erythrobacter sp. TaxID=263913 RepID=UPI0026137EEC|nr:flagellar basal-body MS-ring/collar protein FliF [uncultured Erythrobacter sp.]
MADAAIPATAGGGGLPANTPGLTQVSPGDWRARLAGFTSQPAFRRALPAIVGVGAIATVAALYLAIAQGPQRILFSDLTDGERAKVVETLERSGIGYSIDSSTGVMTVSEDDLYRARSLVATEGSLPAPQGASDMLDSIPLGSSRTLEGERLKMARERELMLTIREIDGIEGVRVHLATPERSVFVRDASAPSASVMVRLVSGRSLSQSQVDAIVNLVSGSVPGLTSDAVRVVDQNGRLLSSKRETALDGLTLQREFEAKLREQVTALLTPLLGEGNFSSQVQVELDQNEITSARESYEPDGVIRSESERNSTRAAGTGPGGIPGVTANTPPPDAELVDGAPEPGAIEGEEGAGAATPTDTETSFQRNYELGREVAVTATRPGGLVKLSVAVAISEAALEAASPLTAEQVQDLVSAAVGASDDRGDQVQVVVSAFESTEMEPLAFYEQPWFAMAVRNGVALLAVLLVLLLAVRPLITRVKGSKDEANDGDDNTEQLTDESGKPIVIEAAAGTSGDPTSDLPQQVELARRLAASQPERAVEALQRMLEPPAAKAGEGAA